MKPAFAAGDLVRLRSGGPPMVVLGWVAENVLMGVPRSGWAVTWAIQGAIRRDVLEACALVAVADGGG